MNYYYCSRACSNASQRFKNKRKRKKSFYFLQDLKLRCNFAPVKNKNDARKEGRVVDYTGLENRRAERHRGFESLSFRNEKKTSIWDVFSRLGQSCG